MTRLSLKPIFLGLTTLAVSLMSPAAMLAVDSFSSSLDGSGEGWGILETITVGGTTYSDLRAGSYSAISVGGTANPKFGIGGVPANGQASLSGNNLDTAALNSSFTVQFGQVVTGDDLFYYFESNNGSSSVGDGNDVLVQAIDSLGAGVGAALALDDIAWNFGNGTWTNDSTFARTPSIAGRDWDREGGSTLAGRQTNSVSWNLADMGLSGNTTVTGFILSTSNADSVAAGLAVIPEPSTFALFGLAGLAAALGLRRRG